MATFTIDLLTGQVYLFTGDFTGSGSTPTTGSTYSEVNVFTSLPSASSASGEIYVVRNGQGTTVLNRKPAGLYYSNGTVWEYLGDTPDGFLSDNFQIVDSDDNTKTAMFETSGITSGANRTLIIQNTDGTIAYLTDLDAKVDLSVFSGYTGTTAPATFLSKTDFNTYTGTTMPANYYNKTEIDAYSASTLLLINAKQDQLVAGDGIILSGNTISVSLPANTIYVAKSGSTYTSVQDGIDAAKDNDVVYVYGGTYNEDVTLKSGMVLKGISGYPANIMGTLSYNGTGRTVVEDMGVRATNAHALDMSGTGSISFLSSNLHSTWDSGVTGQTSGTSKATIKQSGGKIYFKNQCFVYGYASGDNNVGHNLSAYWVTGGAECTLDSFATKHLLMNMFDDAQNISIIFNNNTNADSDIDVHKSECDLIGRNHANNSMKGIYLLSSSGGTTMESSDLKPQNGNEFIAVHVVDSYHSEFLQNNVMPDNVTTEYLGYNVNSESHTCY